MMETEAESGQFKDVKYVYYIRHVTKSQST